jgi:N-acetylmuramoyl-L-alanine amidase
MFKKILVLAGHGKNNGKNDVGAVAKDGTTERSITVAVAQKVVDMLGDYAVGFGIDKKLTISEKTKALNEYCRDNNLNVSDSLLIEIHADWSGASEGVMCYYHGASEESKAFAKVVSASVAKVGNRKDKGNKPDTASRWGSLGIIRDTIPLAILLELDSLRADDNTEDGLELLKSENGQNLMAQAIVDGICEFAGWKKEVSDWAKESVEKATKSGIIKNWDNPQELVDINTLEWIFFNLGVAKEPVGNITKERLAVILDRLKLLD